MIYGVKYRCLWTNHFGQACQLDIKKNNFTDSVTSIYCAKEPVSIDYEGPNENLFDPVWGSQMIMNVVALSNFQFLDLYTNSAREYQVKFYVGGSLEWKGYLLPDHYQGEYRAYPYLNSVIATDQMGYLRTITWDHTDELLTLLQALYYVLEATDLDMPLVEGVNVYEDNHDSATTDSPLDQTYINGNIFDGDSYYDVLSFILNRFNAIIRQKDGEWFIFRIAESFQSFTIRQWTFGAFNFIYNSQTTINLVLSSTSPPPNTAFVDMIRITNGTMTINAAWKNYNLLTDYGHNTNILDNGNFTSWSDDITPLFWDKNGTISIQRQGNSCNIGNATYLNPANSLSQSFTMADGNVGQSLRLSFKLETFPMDLGTTAAIYMQLMMDIGGSLRYFDFDGGNGWDVPFTFMTLNMDVGDKITGDYNYYINLAGIGLSHNIRLSFFPIITTQTKANYNISNVEMEIQKDISSLGNEASEPYSSTKEETITLDESNNYDGGVIKQKLLDSLGINNELTIFDGIMMWDDAGTKKATSNWTSPEITGTLDDILKKSYGSVYHLPQQVISCAVYSKLLNPCSVIKDVDNDDKLFLIKRASWSPKYGRWDVEAHEVQVTPQPLLDSDGNALVDSDGNILYG